MVKDTSAPCTLMLGKCHGSAHSSMSSVSTIELGVPDPSPEILENLGLKIVGNDYVKWRDDASFHPRNWSSSRKTYDASLVLLLDLFT